MACRVSAPASVTGSLTAVVEAGPSTWVHSQITLPPHGPDVAPASVTVLPGVTSRSAPASAAGLNGPPMLSRKLRSVNAVSGSKRSSGSEPRSLLFRYSSVNAVRLSKMPACNDLRSLEPMASDVNIVSSSKTPAGSPVSLLIPRCSSVNIVSSSKTPAGSPVSLLPLRSSVVSPVIPAKSPACRLVRVVLSVTLRLVMAARWAFVTSAQAVTPVILSTMESRTWGVRAQTVGSGTSAPTTMSKSSFTVPPRSSSTVTRTVIVPTADAGGVPEKVQVVSAKLS